MLWQGRSMDLGGRARGGEKWQGYCGGTSGEKRVGWSRVWRDKTSSRVVEGAELLGWE